MSAIVEIIVAHGPTLLAAFGGAWFAFKIQSDREDKKTLEHNVAAGNLAIYRIGCMLVALHNYQKNFVQPVRNDPFAFITMQSTQPNAIERDRLNFDSLVFLFTAGHQNVIPELTAAEHNFFTLFQEIHTRSSLRDNEVYAALDSAGITRSAALPEIQEFERVLGPKLYQTITASTQRIIRDVDLVGRELTNAQDKLITVLEGLFPKATVIRYTPT